MKPEANSQRVLKYTQAIAKMIEFNVPEEDRNINIPKRPEELFTLVIGMLGDISDSIISNIENNKNTEDQENNIRFCASFFDAYKNTERLHSLDDYTLLIGSASYYLCNLPGSAQVLINKLNSQGMDLHASGLEFLLYWLLRGNYSSNMEKPDSLYKGNIAAITKELSLFYLSGINELVVYQECKNLQNIVYQKYSPRELFIADLIYAICIKKIKNSCWKTLPSFSGLSNEIWSSIINKKTFIKELWPAQILLGKENVFRGQSAVIQMATSAGKTKSTEIIIRSAFLAERTNIAVIVAPFRALCNEIRNDYIKAFSKEKDIEINEITDALETEEMNVFENSIVKHIIILTPEKLYYLMIHNPRIAQQVKLVIFDEGHQFDNGERGVTYELLLTALKEYLPPDSQKVLISAVIHNAEDIASWLSSDCKVVKGLNISPTLRNIGFLVNNEGRFQLSFVDVNNPDFEEYFVPRTINSQAKFPDTSKPTEIASYYALKMCKKDTVAIYLNRKDYITNLLKNIIEILNSFPEVNKPIDYCNTTEVKKIQNLVKMNTGEKSILYQATLYGLFPHHTAVPQGVRHAIEYAAHESLINFIVCTSTLAQGVNLPIKYMFISTTKTGEGYFKIRDFHNFIGRVGRAGKLTEGSIIFTDPALKQIPKFWYHTKKLLNADLSENCISSLLALFEPFAENDTSAWGFKDVSKLVAFYYNNSVSALEYVQYFSSQYKNIDEKEMLNKLEQKALYMEKIENFLMMQEKELSHNFVIEIAKSTFAYSIADDEIKKQIIELFVLISNKINEQNISKEKLQIYAKTLKDINSSIKIEKDVFLLKNDISKCNNQIDFFNIFWSILDKNISNKHYCFIKDRGKIKNAIENWLCGNSYHELLNILEGEKVSSNRKITMEYCIDIFENGISYEGSTLISVIAELLPSDIQTEENLKKIVLFQKQLKYGLPTQKSIMLYELGFCDRVIAQELSQIVSEDSNKYLIKQELVKQEEKTKAILDNYPSYYSNVYERILNSMR